MSPVWPCPECGAKKGQAHANTCSHAQIRRRPGFGTLPRKQARKYERHTHNPVVYKTRGDTEYLRCGICERSMGNRKKK